MNWEGMAWDILILVIILEMCMLVIDRLLRSALNLPDRKNTEEE